VAEFLRLGSIPQASTLLTNRGFCDDLEAGKGALYLATAFPRPVWLDHLLPLFTLQDAVTLRATCRALPPIVANMRPDLGERPVRQLKAMLTCFPKAESVNLRDNDPMTPTEQDTLLAWLEERGNSLTSIGGTWPLNGPVIRRAWRAGVFKTVRSVSLNLEEEGDRGLIIDGAISGVEMIFINFGNAAPEVARPVLGYLHFPDLRKITCHMDAGDIALPPFIPPSLTALTLSTYCMEPRLLLGCLPPMIKSSGAGLRDLQLFLEAMSDVTARGVRSLLEACAPTLIKVGLLLRLNKNG
jgi:hypothetical protein